MRILLLCYEFAPFRGGIGRVVEGLAQGAATHGLEPVVYAPDYGKDRHPEDRDRPYRVIRFPGDFCSIVSQRRLFHFSRRVRSAVDRVSPDLVHGVDPPAQMALTALSWAGFPVAPYIFTVHGTELLRYRTELIPRLWMRSAFLRAERVSVVSRAVEELLHRDFRVDPDTTTVDHPSIGDPWHTEPRAARPDRREAWGAAPDDRVVLTVARRVREKGHDRVVEGLATLPAELRRRCLYVVAGTGPEAWARRLHAAAAEAGVRLHLLGPVPDDELVSVYDTADLFVMLSRTTPTRLEGFGLTYLEAGARGLPSLACAVGGVPEAVLHGETGWVLPADAGPPAVGAALARLLEDGELRRRLGEAAHQRSRHFTHARYASDVYRPNGAARGS